MKDDLITVLSDCRTCLQWLKIITNNDYDIQLITEVIKRVDDQITIELCKIK